MSCFSKFYRITSCEKWDLPHERPRFCSTHSLRDFLPLWRVLTQDSQNLSSDLTLEVLTAALQRLKPGKAPGPDSICPELILHAGSEIKSSLCKFLSSCLCNLKIQKIWTRALIVAILKPNNPPENPKSYRPISFLGIPFKIFECLIYARAESTINLLLPREQAGFRHGRSTVDQVTLLI